MKVATLLPLAAMAIAAPASEGPATGLSGSILPHGWSWVDSAEVVRRRMAEADGTDSLEKRKPGNASDET